MEQKDDPFFPTINTVLCFLYSLYKNGNKGNGLGYSAIATARSAISTVANVDGAPAGQHQLVHKFMRAVFNNRPALPKLVVTWDVDLVLQYLKTLTPVKKIPLDLLTKKLVVLLLLLSGQRGQTIQLLDVRNMTLTFSKVTFRIGDLTKTSRPGCHTQELCFKAYAPDRRLCVVTVIFCYLERTLDIRGVVKNLILTTKKPFNAASRDTIRRWTKDILTTAGVDMSIFSPHSTRSAATSKAMSHVPLDTILKTAGWAKESTFRKYYLKPVTEAQTLTVLEN